MGRITETMNLFITLDYELFLGTSTGTVENCLIKSMDAMCEVAEKYGFKYIIFVDAAYLLRLRQLKDSSESILKQYELVVHHIQDLAKRGHDIQLHFHPQWLYSEWDDMKEVWKMDKDHYKLSDMPLEDARCRLKEAKELLEQIVRKKIIAFRAGGFCHESFSELKDVFYRMGVIVDSSVLRNKCFISSVHSYDYRVIPQQQIYCFENSIKEVSPKGSFVELSISSFYWSPIRYFSCIRPIRIRFSPRINYGDGSRVSDGKRSPISSIRDVLSRRYYHASIDGEWSNLLDVYYNDAKNNNWKELILIGHPKNASDLSVKNLDKFFSSHPQVRVLTTYDIINKVL